MIDWQPRALALADQLTDSGELRGKAWREAFGVVPRHMFVPRFHTATGEVVDGTNAADTERWLDEVYADTVLITQTRQVGNGPVLPTSSSTMPGIMAWMLEALDVQDGHRVLEVGTGTGYNAALLSHRLGDHNVASVDLDPDLVSAAGARLAQLGYRPTLVAGDGADGVPGDTFDRIVCTAAVDHVPPAWIEQLTPGGRIVTDMRGPIGGALATLTLTDHGVVEGRFSSYRAAFMPLRPKLDDPAGPGNFSLPVTIDTRDGHQSSTTINPADEVFSDRAFRFFLQLHLAGTGVGGFTPTEGDPYMLAANTSGAWLMVSTSPDDDGTYRVQQGGGVRVWDTVEAAHQLWSPLDKPAIDRFGVSATTEPHTQYVWLDTSDGHLSWPLPL